MKNLDRKFLNDTVIEDVGPYSTISGEFKCERYPNTPPLDTSVNIHIKDIAILWNEREALMKDLAEVLKKYMI